MGRVWRATDVVLHRDVAIKELVPPPGLTADERQEMRERSLREARAIARLNHINVVRVFDVLRTDADPWIVMEYVASRSLQDTLASDGPFDAVRAAEIGLGVLGALRAAHRAGVVHRDVKPGNVLLGSDGRVVLTDFGLATVPGDPNVTRTGLVLGSPAYIAPERARDGTAGPAADLWSLGATLYAAVEGASPFARPSAIATLAALATENPPPARNAGPLKPVLNGLLRKDPSHRINADEAERLLLRAAGRRSKMSFPMSPTMRRPGIGRERPALPGGPGSVGAAPVVPNPRPPATPSGQAPVSPARPTTSQGRPPVYVPGKAPVGRPAEDTPARADAPRADATQLDATRVDTPAINDKTKLFGTRRGSSTAAGQSATSPAAPADAAPSGGLTRTRRGEQGSFTAADVAAHRRGQTAPEQAKAPSDATALLHPPAADGSTPPESAAAQPAVAPSAPAQTRSGSTPQAAAVSEAAPAVSEAAPAAPDSAVAGTDAALATPSEAQAGSARAEVSASSAGTAEGTAPSVEAVPDAESAPPAATAEPGTEVASPETVSTAADTAPPQTVNPTPPAAEKAVPSGATATRPKPGKTAKKSRPSPGHAASLAAVSATAASSAEPAPPQAEPAPPQAEPAPPQAEPTPPQAEPTTDSKVAVPAQPDKAGAESAPGDTPAEPAQSTTGTMSPNEAAQGNDPNHPSPTRPRGSRSKTTSGTPSTSEGDDNAPVSPIPALGLPQRPAWRPMDVRPSQPGVTVFGTRLTYRQATVGAVALLVVLILLIILVAQALGGDDKKAAENKPAPGPTAATNAPTTASSAAASTQPTSKPPSSAPTSAAATTPAPGAITLPAGWKWHKEKADGKYPAFTIPVPNAASKSYGRDGEVQFRWNNRLLLVGRTSDPESDVLADWRVQEEARKGDYQNYRLLKPIAYVTYPGFKQAADWEFLYTTSSGNDQHVVKRNILVSTKLAYSLNWYTSTGDWNAAKSDLNRLYQGFQPK